MTPARAYFEKLARRLRDRANTWLSSEQDRALVGVAEEIEDMLREEDAGET
jgi:hypothetical protein